jgi:hypothetical protein
MFGQDGLQRLNQDKTKGNVAATEERLRAINAKLNKSKEDQQIYDNKSTHSMRNGCWDWTKSYETFSKLEDIEDLEQQQKHEEQRLESLLRR